MELERHSPTAAERRNAETWPASLKREPTAKLRTVNGPNCPRVYSTISTGTKPEEHGVTGFLVGGITANSNMLKEEPIWSIH